MAAHPIHGIELFSGVGMLGEGLRAGLAYLGIPYRTICHVEREAHAAAVLVARMEEGSMDAAPIWSDVTTFNARQWYGKVDCIVAGFPCQDLSVAGRRAGLDGARSGLFFEVLRVADDCNAWLIVLENVGGIASATATVVDAEEGELEERAAARVLGELADRGWNAEWLTLSASDVGASHGRERWFCVAWRAVANADNDGGESGRISAPSRWERQADSVRAGDTMDDAVCSERRSGSLSGSRCEQGLDGEREEDGRLGIAGPARMGDAQGDGRRQGRTEPARREGRSDPAGTGLQLADTGSPGREERERDGGVQQEALRPLAGEAVVCGSDSLLFAPGPADPRWPEIIADRPFLAPAIAAGSVCVWWDDATRSFRTEAPQSSLRSVADGLAVVVDESRNSQLRCIGNGVVAAQAACAVVELFRRAGLDGI